MTAVLLDQHDGYATITLNRPERKNALGRELRSQFVAAVEKCSADAAIRVLIITGQGDSFCAGFDLKELGSAPTGNAGEITNSMARAMERFEGPIIGAINGHAITGGFELALACDVLIAADTARFADTHARVGILPGWGLSQKLPRLIGLSRAKEIAFTGSPISAERAYEWGLVNHVVPAAQLMERATAIARAMCGNLPELLKQYKRLIDEGYSMPYADALQWEEEQAIASALRTSPERIEARRQAIMARGREERSFS